MSEVSCELARLMDGLGVRNCAQRQNQGSVRDAKCGERCSIQLSATTQLDTKLRELCQGTALARLQESSDAGHMIFGASEELEF